MALPRCPLPGMESRKALMWRNCDLRQPGKVALKADEELGSK